MVETAPAPLSPLGVLLVRLRKQADLTQEALAERAGVSVNTISNLEAGRGHLPRASTLDLLAEALAPSEAEQVELRATLREAARAIRASGRTATPESAVFPQEAPIPSPPAAGRLTFLVCLPVGAANGQADHLDAAYDLSMHLMPLLRQVVAQHGGYLVSPLEGPEGALGVFPLVARAVDAACALQRALWEPRSTDVPARRRVGEAADAEDVEGRARVPPLLLCLALHTGWAEPGSGDYAGPTRRGATRLARLAAAGQLLLSASTRESLGRDLPDDVRLVEGGRHTLSVVERPQAVYHLVPAALPQFRMAPLRALPAPTAALPLQLTSFIGREREQAAVGALLEAAPLVTLVGTGGSGKTRLALAVAAERLEDYPDGVWWVELAALDDGALVPQAMATTLGLREEAGQPLLAALSARLQGARALLVLDNCEHLLGACAELAVGLLRRCPHLHLLATSRERLGVGGERSYWVPALAVPEAHEPVTPATLAALQEVEGVRLFVERARAGQTEFTVTRDNAAVVARICRALDGLPLAIELAAARVGSLPLDELAGRLDESLELLGEGPRDLPARQRGLRATLEWSWTLLGSAERVVLRRLAVFRGGGTVEAAAVVCGGAELGGQPTVGVLGGLVSKSLVVLQENEGQGRYGLLETVRQYAAEQLGAAGEAPAIRARHLGWTLELAETAELRLSGPELRLWLERLETELDNLRAALGWAREQGDGVRLLRLAGTLWRFWLLRGHFSEGRRWLEAALQLEGGRGEPAVRARALAAAGALACEQGDAERAVVLLEEALALRRSLGETGGIADALSNLGNVVTTQGDYERAVVLYEESVALARPLGEPWRTANVLNNLGNVATLQGDYDRAAAVLEEALALWRTLEDIGGTASSLHNRGIVAYFQGDQMRAASLLSEALQLSYDVGDKDLTMEGLEGLAWVAVARGQPERAARLGGAAEAQRAALAVPLEQDKQAGHAQALQGIRTALGVEVLAHVWAEGCALSLEEAVALALSGERTPTA